MVGLIGNGQLFSKITHYQPPRYDKCLIGYHIIYASQLVKQTNTANKSA